MIPGLDVLIVTFVLLLFLSITIEATEHPFNSLSKYFLIFKSEFKYLAKSLVGAYHLLSQSLLTPTLSPTGLTFCPMLVLLLLCHIICYTYINMTTSVII